jgi:hypothetical protein
VFHHYLLQMVLIWAAMGDFLVFSALHHLLRHLSSLPITAGAAADCFLAGFGCDRWVIAVDRWVIRRGPLGGVEDQLSSTFSGLWLPVDHLLLELFTMSDG